MEHKELDLSIITMAVILQLMLFWNISIKGALQAERAQTIPSEIPVVETQQDFQLMKFEETENIKQLRTNIINDSVNYWNCEMEEECEIRCLFYATIPLGKYYCTAYNHEETGSKITASGAICHEGTITTCASDIKYLPFSTYLEIDGRLFKCEDTGSAVRKKHVDLYFKSYSQMAKYNTGYRYIYKVEFPFGVPKEE